MVIFICVRLSLKYNPPTHCSNCKEIIMEIKMKHCRLFGHDWIVKDDRIIYKGQEILLSDITKISNPTKSMGQIIFQFRTKQKWYTVDCWTKQENDFNKVLKHIGDHSSDPAYWKKPIAEMTEEEKETYFKYAYDCYQNNLISIFEFDAIKVGCLRTEPMFDPKTAMTMQSAILKAKVDSLYKNKNNGTKTIIKDAVIGGVVAGPAGAVVGAIVGKNAVDNKK